MPETDAGGNGKSIRINVNQALCGYTDGLAMKRGVLRGTRIAGGWRRGGVAEPGNGECANAWRAGERARLAWMCGMKTDKTPARRRKSMAKRLRPCLASRRA